MIDTTVKSDYGTDNIRKLSQRDAVRERSSMYVGSSGVSGINQLFKEIWDNSVDEFTAGYGKRVEVYVDKDGSGRVVDYGRGIPVGEPIIDEHGNKTWVLTQILTTLHMGGKFKDDNNYQYKIGMNGVGSSCVNFLSEYFNVTVKRDGKIYQQKFEKGYPVTEVITVGETNETGTEIEWLPDKEIFKHTIFPNNEVKHRLNELACLNAGLEIYFKDDIQKKEYTFLYEDGISGYTNKLIGNKSRLFDEPISFNGEYIDEENRHMYSEISMIYDNEVENNGNIKTFVNNSNTHEGGYHLQGFKTAIKTYFNEYALAKKLIKEPIETQYWLDGLYATINMKISGEVELEGQTKTKLGNVTAKDAIIDVVKNFFQKNAKKKNVTPILDAIVNRAIKVKEAEIAARKARSLSRQSKKVLKVALPGKLADCSNRNGYNELWICEGDSAAGSMKEGRDKAYQAVLGLKGKILNVNKADLGKILNSDTIKGIVAAIGGGIGNNFNLNDVRYEKIIMACDADVDGSHIRTLVLTLMYYYMGDLLKSGMVYSAQPPLYRIIKKNNESVYLLSDSALKEYKTKHKSESFKLMRFKGYGSPSPYKFFY